MITEQRRRVMGALGQAHGKLYVELQEARAALSDAIDEIGHLQEQCAKLRDECVNLRKNGGGLI